jgi:hypothetical protein
VTIVSWRSGADVACSCAAEGRNTDADRSSPLQVPAVVQSPTFFPSERDRDAANRCFEGRPDVPRSPIHDPRVRSFRCSPGRSAQPHPAAIAPSPLPSPLPSPPYPPPRLLCPPQQRADVAVAGLHGAVRAGHPLPQECLPAGAQRRRSVMVGTTAAGSCHPPHSAV